MLEAGIAIISLVIGVIIGWWSRSKSSPGENSEKVARLEEELRNAQASEVAARTTVQHLQTQFEAEKKRLEEIRAAMENSFKAMAADIALDNSKAFSPAGRRAVQVSQGKLGKGSG